MRKNVSLLLIGLGGFLLVAALILAVWAPGKVKRTPLNTDSYSRLEGQAKYQNQPEGRVEALQRNRVIGDKSNDDRVVFQVFQCLYKDPDNKLNACPGPDSSATITQEGDKPNDRTSVANSTFASDRKTGQAIATGLPADVGPRSGLVNKFPFDTEKKNYPLWDNVVKRTNTAVYQGEEKLKGLTVYKFVVKAEQKGATFTTGLGPVKGDYTSERTLWVDPVTGAIQNNKEKQQRVDTGGKNLIDLDYGFTDAQVADNVDKAKSDGRKIAIVRVAPWVLLPLGLLLILGGLLLRRGSGGAHAAAGRRRGNDGEGDHVDQDDTRDQGELVFGRGGRP